MHVRRGGILGSWEVARERMRNIDVKNGERSGSGRYDGVGRRRESVSSWNGEEPRMRRMLSAKAESESENMGYRTRKRSRALFIVFFSLR